MSTRKREAEGERRTIVTVHVNVTQTRNSGAELCPRLTWAQDFRDKIDVLRGRLDKENMFLVFVNVLIFVIGTGKLQKGRNLEGREDTSWH